MSSGLAHYSLKVSDLLVPFSPMQSRVPQCQLLKPALNLGKSTSGFVMLEKMSQSLLQNALIR